MTVDDVFFIRGRGVIATGRVEEGPMRVGDPVVVPRGKADLRARIVGLEMFRRKLDEAHPGDMVGVVLDGVEKGDVVAGDVLYADGAI